MQFYSIVFILLTPSAFGVSSDCGRVLGSDRGVNGFPWTVLIVRRERQGLAECTGSLISPSVVVTAASCFYNEETSSKIDTNRSTVSAFDFTEEDPLHFQMSDIKTIHLARGYQGRRTFHAKNIAWLILENPFNITSNIRTVCIDFKNEYEREDLQSGPVSTINHCTEMLASMRTLCSDYSYEWLWSHFKGSSVEFPNYLKSRAGTAFHSEHDGRWYIRGTLSRDYSVRDGPGIISAVINIGRFINEMKGYIEKKNYECGIVTLPVNPLIVGGYRAEPGGSPWHVAVYRKNSTGYYDQICGGSLISLNAVISAAHCFYDESIRQPIDARHYAVAAGKLKRPYNWLERFVQKSPVDTIHISTRYHGIQGLYAVDIAWLILKNPFYLSASVTPICLESNSQDVSARLQDRQVGKVAGWGLTADDIPSHDLQEMSASVVPYDDCISTLPEDAKAYVTLDKFCAGHVNGTMLCNGDSGGGLAFQRNGHWYLRGIVSINPIFSMTCNTHSYTAFTDVVRYTDELFRFTNITTRDLI